MEVATLVDNPEGATVQWIVAEVMAKAPPQAGLAAVAGISALGSASVAAATEAARWVAPAPRSIRMRLFCLPYAGGVSENVFGR